LAGFGAYLLLFAVWMLVDPGSWYQQIGPFGPENDHNIRDGATFQIALGLACLVACRMQSWRLPVLFILAVEFGLHAVNHLVDIGESQPARVGPGDFAALAISTVVLGWLLAGEWTNGRGKQ
jgi:hypothetical protein